MFCKYLGLCPKCLSPVPIDRESQSLKLGIYRTAGSYDALLQFLGF